VVEGCSEKTTYRDDARREVKLRCLLGGGHSPGDLVFIARWGVPKIFKYLVGAFHDIGLYAAIDDLTSALTAMGEGQYGRAEASLRVDLALAFRARGDRAEARLHAQRAADLAGRTGSERQRRRIADLVSV